MDVQEIMSAQVQTLDPEDTLNCAAKLMREHALGCVPIVSSSGVIQEAYVSPSRSTHASAGR